MSLLSLTFLAFMLVAWGVFQLLPGRWKLAWLLAASLAFLALWRVEFAILLSLLAPVDYAVGRQLAPGRERRKAWLWLGIVVNLGALVGGKYGNSVVAWGAGLFGLATAVSEQSWLLPVGLSFLVVQGLAYFADVYQGVVKAEANLVNFGLFMLFFPKVVCGPIERARGFLKQINDVGQAVSCGGGTGRSPTGERTDSSPYRWGEAASLILSGLARKILLADPLLRLLPADIFRNPLAYPAWELWLGLIGYAFALYNDFTGYSSLARGMARLFGFELTSNFNAPFLARSLAEFWARWHISLSNTLKDLIYTPLTRSLLRRKYGRTHPLTIAAAPLLTMSASGLWHGAWPNLLGWGLLHGVYQVNERARAVFKPGPPPQLLPRGRQLLAGLGTFLLTLLAWAPFRMPLGVAGQYLWGMLAVWRAPVWRAPVAGGTLGAWSWASWVVGVAVVSLAWDAWQLRQGELAARQWRPTWRWALAAVVTLSLAAAMYLGGQPLPFIYQGF